MPKMTAARAEREGRNDIAVNVIPSRRVVVSSSALQSSLRFVALGSVWRSKLGGF